MSTFGTQRSEFGIGIKSLVTELIEETNLLSEEAEKLLEPIRERRKISYRILAGHKRYWISSLENAYPADLQRIIELHEDKSFDSLGLPYLLPEDIEVISNRESKATVFEIEDRLVSLESLLAASKINSMLHYSHE